MLQNQFNRSRAGLLACLLLFLPAILTTIDAQKYFFDNYSVKQGLSVQKVYTLFQDSRDYLWLGTENGVSRFDGKKFDNYTSRNGLAIGGVWSILQDSQGNIWFGHLNGGISFYNGNSFERVAFDSLDLTGDVTSITQIGDSALWFTSITDGAIRADFPVKDISHIKATQFRGKDGLSDKVSDAMVNSSGEYICIADVGMRKFNPELQKFENYRLPHMTSYFSTICILNDRKGNVWFGTHNGGLYRYVMSQSRMDFFDLPKLGIKSNTVTCLTEDSRGRVWFGTWGAGVAFFEGDSLRKLDESNGLKTTIIHDIIEDVEGNILIADHTYGLTIFKGDAFITLNEKEILPDQNINAITTDKTGAVWFGTNAGIVRFWSAAGKKPVIYNQENSSISEDIRFLKKDRTGNIWIGTFEEGVIMFNINTSKFESQAYIDSSTLYYGDQVTTGEIDRQNHLWIGTLNGVVMGTIGENNFEFNHFKDSLTFNRITALYCDPAGNMWIGTEPIGDKPGLIRYDQEKKHFFAVSKLPGIIPKTLVMDSKGILWIGTGEGLIALRNDSVLANVTQDDGLLSNNINLLADGGDGSIYIGTNKGLNRYFPETKRVFSYTEKNGFTGIETKPNAVYRTPAGDLWFGTANGATRLIPDKLVTKELEPLTHILSMRVNNEPEPREMVPGMRLKYSEGSILFDYYSICLTNPDVVRYKVKLEGADKDWQDVTDQPRVNYPALAPGKYTFMVIACNSQGVWNTEPATFHFIIKPPFYLSWWFILISLCTIIVSVITYVKLREQNLVRENEKLEVKVKERTAEVVQKSEIIEEKNRDITASIRYAERIQRALLPREEHFHFVDIFVLYMPKDIVSGDFYWMYDNGESLFIAAVDCTGHGVPGAFMSIIGHNSLNRVVKELGFTRPSSILDHLNVEVTRAIMQSHEKGINDGMDLALISYHKKTKSVELAGAFNPLYKVRKGDVIVHKTDRFAIGMRTVEQKKNFTNFEIDIQSGDMLYLFSDGYADQFGKVNGKKFKTVNIKRILSEIWNVPVTEQKARLEKEILEWKGELSQVDDIMIIGMRIPD